MTDEQNYIAPDKEDGNYIAPDKEDGEFVNINPSEDSEIEKNRTSTFKHHFCDYDISDMASNVKTERSEMESEEGEIGYVIEDERWYDKSSAAYFTSTATRNAQTVSWKQRHRPIF